jgi:hypothetical protein
MTSARLREVLALLHWSQRGLAGEIFLPRQAIPYSF